MQAPCSNLNYFWFLFSSLVGPHYSSVIVVAPQTSHYYRRDHFFQMRTASNGRLRNGWHVEDEEPRIASGGQKLQNSKAEWMFLLCFLRKSFNLFDGWGWMQRKRIVLLASSAALPLSPPIESSCNTIELVSGCQNNSPTFGWPKRERSPLAWWTHSCRLFFLFYLFCWLMNKIQQQQSSEKCCCCCYRHCYFLSRHHKLKLYITGVSL